MYDESIKEQFVELRAQGKSFATITEQLGVSKPTLIEWSQKLQQNIANLRAINDEALYEKYRVTKERYLALLSSQLEGVETELRTRSLEKVPTGTLYSLLFKIMGALQTQGNPLTLQCVDLPGYIEPTVKMTWEA